MKKHVFLLGLAVIAMSSCTNDEVLEQAQPVQETIGFESFINKTTRATNDVNMTTNALKEFYVFGYYGTGTEVFTNAAVLNVNSGWNVQEQELWTKNKYTFAAYADGVGTGAVETPTDADKLSNVEFSNGTLTFTNYSLKDKDLIAAHAIQDNSDGANQDDVSLTFSHLLSKVSFKFVYTDKEHEHIKMNISNIRLNVPLTATCSSKTNSTSWNSYSGSKVYTLADQSEVGTTAAPAEPEEFYVIPEATIADATTLTFTVEYYDDSQNDKPEVETRNYTLKLNTGKLKESESSTVDLSAWAANAIYNYTVNLPFDPLYIDFTVGGVSDWQNTYSPTITPNDTPVGGN